jgi:uncharacterized membrane protein YqaE (UPF0057 family)
VVDKNRDIHETLNPIWPAYIIRSSAPSIVSRQLLKDLLFLHLHTSPIPNNSKLIVHLFSKCATAQIYFSALSQSSSHLLVVCYLPHHFISITNHFAVWVKRGICSGDSIINILLCVLGYLPGLIHAWVCLLAPDSNRHP